MNSAALMEVYPYALKRGKRLVRFNHQGAEDIAHDAIISLLEAGHGDMPAKFMMKDLKFRTATAASGRSMDRLAVSFDGFDQIAPAATTDPLFVRRVMAVVDTMLPRDQEIFRLRVFEDLTSEEVAEHLGISKSLVDKRFPAACRQLQEAFGVELETIRETTLTLRHDDGRQVSGIRKEVAAEIGSNHRIISKLVTGDKRSWHGWRVVR